MKPEKTLKETKRTKEWKVETIGKANEPKSHNCQRGSEGRQTDRCEAVMRPVTELFPEMRDVSPHD